MVTVLCETPAVPLYMADVFCCVLCRCVTAVELVTTPS